MRPKLSIEIVGLPDRDDLVAEVWAGTCQFAELRREGCSFVGQIYPPPENSCWWKISFDEVVNSLVRAQKRLAGEE